MTELVSAIATLAESLTQATAEGLLSQEAVAEVLGVEPSTVESLAKRPGGLRYVRAPGHRSRMFRAADVRDFIDRYVYADREAEVAAKRLARRHERARVHHAEGGARRRAGDTGAPAENERAAQVGGGSRPTSDSEEGNQYAHES